MKSSKIAIILLILALATGCGSGGGGGGGSSTSPTVTTTTPAPLQSISVSPENSSIGVGKTEQFIATGTNSDNSARNLTTSVNWTSSAPAIASIGASTGLATAIAAGTTTITATSGGISRTATLTVAGGGIANNEIPITVNGALCSANSYNNKPCVSVKVCAPGTSTCQTVNDILLDTGSFGLRIFKQVLTVLPAAGGSLAECIQFGDGSSVWGPVQQADVILGNEPAVSVPIQVIDSTFGTLPAVCSNAHPSPASAGYNGILGVGFFKQDCGTVCENFANNGIYFSCGATCSGTTVLRALQVQNPVALLPQDNNGILVQLASVPLGGAPSVDGKLILGIGTQPNNTPSAVTAYPASPTTGDFKTVFGGSTYGGFLDSGSNGLLFTPPAASPIQACGNLNAGWFCPSPTTSFSATNSGFSGTPSSQVLFQIGHYNNLTANASNNVFVEIGGPFPVSFDWGLPFFYGRNVFLGFGGATSSLGIGPFWAY